MLKSLKVAAVLAGSVFVLSTAEAETISAAEDLQAFKDKVMELGLNSGEWGGTYDAKYFVRDYTNGKYELKFAEKGVHQAWPTYGEESPVLDEMNIQFDVHPKLKTLGYVYQRVPGGVIVGAETDFQVCQYADPRPGFTKNNASNSQPVRGLKTPLPRVVVFKQEALNVAVAKTLNAKIIPAVEALVESGQIQQADYENKVKELVANAMPEIEQGVKTNFSNEYINRKLYGDLVKDPRILALPESYRNQLKLGDEVIGFISGKRCMIEDADKSWDELEDLNVPVIRAEIIDGTLYMTAVLNPYVLSQYGEISQGYSIYEQTPGAKEIPDL